MAHFARLEEETDQYNPSQKIWVVKEIVVVGNDIQTSNGSLGENDMHLDGETYCQNLFKGGIWKQTSYNNKFRKQFAGKNFYYDFTKDRFIAGRPFPSWYLNNNDDWKPPVEYPSITNYTENSEEKPYVIFWIEEDKTWKARKEFDQSVTQVWNPINLIWNQI